MVEDEMIKRHHQLNGPEFEQTLGDGEEQGSLAGCSSRGHRVRHDLVTEQIQQGHKKGTRGQPEGTEFFEASHYLYDYNNKNGKNKG